MRIVYFVAFVLLPAGFIVAFASRMVEANAHSYPRLYPPVVKRLALIIAYLTAVVWFIMGLHYLWTG